MTKINTGGPAFAHGNHEQGCDSGMTLRDYFAGQAMAAIIAKAPILQNGVPPISGFKSATNLQKTAIMDAVSVGAYDYSDAMIAARGDGQ